MYAWNAIKPWFSLAGKTEQDSFLDSLPTRLDTLESSSNQQHLQKVAAIVDENKSKGHATAHYDSIAGGMSGDLYIVPCGKEEKVCVLKTMVILNRSNWLFNIREVVIPLLLQESKAISLFQTMQYARSQMYMLIPKAGHGSLQHALDKKELNATQLLVCMRQVESALIHMHRSGFIHNDVKPDNILLLSSEQAQLADFGISRALLDSAPEEHALDGSVLFMPIAYRHPVLAQKGLVKANDMSIKDNYAFAYTIVSALQQMFLSAKETQGMQMYLRTSLHSPNIEIDLAVNNWFAAQMERLAWYWSVLVNGQDKSQAWISARDTFCAWLLYSFTWKQDFAHVKQVIEQAVYKAHQADAYHALCVHAAYHLLVYRQKKRSWYSAEEEPLFAQRNQLLQWMSPYLFPPIIEDKAIARSRLVQARELPIQLPRVLRQSVSTLPHTTQLLCKQLAQKLASQFRSHKNALGLGLVLACSLKPLAFSTLDRLLQALVEDDDKSKDLPLPLARRAAILLWAPILTWTTVVGAWSDSVALSFYDTWFKRFSTPENAFLFEQDILFSHLAALAVRLRV